jgi:hypothetical protein
MRGSIAEARRANNGVFGTTSLWEPGFPRERPAQKNAPPLKLFSPSPPTAELGLIRDFIRLGILTEITGQRRWRAYAFDRYLNLF